MKFLRNIFKPKKLGKILLISHEMSYTGAPIALLKLAKVLIKYNYQVEVWSIKDGDFKQEFKKYGINVLFVSNSDFKEPYLVNKFKKFNLIICNSFMTYIPYSVVKFFVPTVWYIQEAKVIDEYSFSEKIVNALTSSNNIYCVSEYAKDFITEKFNKNVKVLHNYIEDKAISNNHNYYKDDVLNLLLLGVIEPRKRINIVMEAIKLLPMDKQDKIKFRFAGAYRNDLYGNDILMQASYMRNVEYLGLITDEEEKNKLLNDTDIVIVPSQEESCSLVALEATMMSCPVILSENVGAKYLVDKDCGWVFETDNVEQLSGILNDILDKKYDIPTMGKSARKKYETFANPETYEQNVLKMVEENINNKELIFKA